MFDTSTFVDELFAEVPNPMTQEEIIQVPKFIQHVNVPPGVGIISPMAPKSRVNYLILGRSKPSTRYEFY